MPAKKTMSASITIVGWKEWCSLPDLGIPIIKAKIDTGARTSSLHTTHMEHFKQNQKDYVKFMLYPLQKNTAIQKLCQAEVIDLRHIKNSGGHIEERAVIRTHLQLGSNQWPIEITLTNRNSMRFRMLLGRQAFKSNICINPNKPYYQKRYSRKTAICYYETHL